MPNARSMDWPKLAPVQAEVLLKLDGALAGEKLLTNLSAGTRVGDTLFVASDEGNAIERLVSEGEGHWSGHARFALPEFLPVADPRGEVDIEGLAADDGWLWVLGSHARTRPKPDKAEDGCIDLARLADLKDTRSRCLLARLPLVPDPDVAGALKPVSSDGAREAGMVKQTGKGSRLAEAFAADPLLAPFTRVPAKEGGIDVEGVAIAGDRVALGMRGPVICTFALMLELAIEMRLSGRLRLARPPVKRLLDLQGLGIRDLKRCGDDLLILAGPTTGLSGPCALYRWPHWVRDAGGDTDLVALHRPELLFYIPFGHGVDHPEGLALWPREGGQSVLVLYDSPAPQRIDKARRTIVADLFELPGAFAA